MKKQTIKQAGLVALALTGAGWHNIAEAAIRVQLNGQPLATKVPPVQMRNRTLVPMRDIFEALGASVQWNDLTQGVTAQKGASSISLQIGNRSAIVNGQRVNLQQPAVLFGGTTMVPLRFVSEALGASVDWNDTMQLVSIKTANDFNSNTIVAYNPNPVTTPPVNPPAYTAPAPAYNPSLPAYNAPNAPAYNPNTPVANDPNFDNAPLSNSPRNNDPRWANDDEADSGEAVAGARTISVPEGVVVPLTLDETISSKTARVGETFTATVASQRLGDSEFPAGSKIEGVIVEARPHQGSQPGVLAFDFQSVVFPNGVRQSLRGDLISLSDRDVRTAGGRIVARNTGKSRGDKLKIIGIGAGVGYVLGRVLDKNTTVSTAIGAAGGFILGRRSDKAAEATLSKGSRLGMRLNDRVTYADRTGYAEYRTTFLRTS